MADALIFLRVQSQISLPVCCRRHAARDGAHPLCGLTAEEIRVVEEATQR